MATPGGSDDAAPLHETAQPLDSAVVFSSILHKKGRINPAWKRRFVTLDSACRLRYYKHEGDARPRNTLTVESVIDVPDIASKGGRSLRFDVLCREHNRVLSLSAAQTDLKTEWLAALARHAQQRPLNSHPTLAELQRADPNAVAMAIAREDASVLAESVRDGASRAAAAAALAAARSAAGLIVDIEAKNLPAEAAAVAAAHAARNGAMESSERADMAIAAAEALKQLQRADEERAAQAADAMRRAAVEISAAAAAAAGASAAAAQHHVALAEERRRQEELEQQAAKRRREEVLMRQRAMSARRGNDQDFEAKMAAEREQKKRERDHLILEQNQQREVEEREARERELREAKEQARVEAQAQAQARAEAEAQAQAQARARAEAEAEAQAQARTRAEAETQAQAQARAEAEAQAQALAQAQARAQAQAQAHQRQQQQLLQNKRDEQQGEKCPAQGAGRWFGACCPCSRDPASQQGLQQLPSEAGGGPVVSQPAMAPTFQDQQGADQPQAVSSSALHKTNTEASAVSFKSMSTSAQV